jgi:hypothetical protein
VIKSIIVVSILFLTVSISRESYAQEPDEANSTSAGHATESASPHKSSATATTGDQSIVRTANGRTAVVPVTNLFPLSDPVALRTINTAVVPPAAPALGLQHEFHGVFSTTYTITNGVPR